MCDQEITNEQRAELCEISIVVEPHPDPGSLACRPLASRRGWRRPRHRLPPLQANVALAIDQQRHRVHPGVCTVCRACSPSRQMQGRAIQPRSSENLLSGIRQVVHVEAVDLEPARETSPLLLHLAQELGVALDVFRPEHHQTVVSQAIMGERNRGTANTLVCSAEHGIQPVGSDVLASECDGVVIACEAFRHCLSYLLFQVERVEFRSNERGDHQAPPFSLRPAVACHHATQRLGSFRDRGVIQRKLSL